MKKLVILALLCSVSASYTAPKTDTPAAHSKTTASRGTKPAPRSPENDLTPAMRRALEDLPRATAQAGRAAGSQQN